LSVLTVAQQTLETKRVDTRQNSRVGEHLSTNRTLRHIIQFFLGGRFARHFAVADNAAAMEIAPWLLAAAVTTGNWVDHAAFVW